MLRKTLCLLLAVLLFLGPTPVWGQPGSVQMDAAGQARDAAADVDRGLLWVAVYDADEVWALNPKTGERLQRINVGNGPAALAVSPDGNTLAVVNALDNALSLVDLSTAEVISTLPVGEAPADVVALPDGGFVVANSLSGSLTRVEPTGTATEIADVALAPVALARSGNAIALASRGEATLRLLDPATLTVARTIKLPAPPRFITSTDAGTFAVADAAGMHIVDAGRGAVTQSATLKVEGIAFDGARLVTLQEGAIVTHGADLVEQSRQGLQVPADRLTATAGLVVALAPRQRALTVMSGTDATWTARTGQVTSPPTVESVPAPAPEPVAEPAPAPSQPEPQAEKAEPESVPVSREAMGGPLVVAEAEDAPASDEAESVAEEVPEPAPVPEPEPMPEPAPAPEPEPMPAPTSEVEPEPVMEATASAPVATTPGEEAPEVEAGAPSTPAESPEPQQEVANAERGETRPAGWRRNPLQFQSVRAPRVGLRAPVSPLSGPNDLTIMDALARPTEFAAPEFGFEMPDWQEPFRDIQADVMNQNLTSDDLNLEGNVKLRMGDMLFESDAFEYREGDGLISADGNVKVSQMQSTITASGFDYYLRAPEELPPPTLLDANPSEQERAKQRLTLGRIDAENIHIMEPTRELIAESIEYDMLTSQGELINARGKAGIYYFFAERLVVTGPSSFYGEEVWITTCECSEDDPPPYRLRMRNVEIVDGELIGANHARLQIKNFNTPLYFPVWRRGGNKVYPWTVDFDSGRRAEVGYFLNVAQQYQVTPDLYIGPRIYPTEKEGVGFGIDVDYDFMETPSSRLFRSKGSIESLYTTKDRGYVHAYHRYQHSDDLVLRMQAEYWGDEAFYRDFYYDKYRNRTSPRTFANVTYRRPGYIATGTARVNPHSWVRETERLPEGTFHLLERSLGGGFYFTYDNVTGYNEREPRGAQGTRTINLARLTYDLDLAPAFSITPFAEVEASWYSDQRDSDASETRLATNFGVTAQTRFHRVYPGRFGFSAIKHLVVPSITYSYRPKTNIDVTEAPIFDSWDNVAGQSRLETKLDNIFYGKDAETGETWQLGRISLYQGNDFWNEQRKTEDYEIEVDIRPRPWWGFQLVGERHIVQNDLDINDPGFLETWLAERLDRWFDYRLDNEIFDFNAQYGDYNRVLTQLYYDNTPLGGRWSTRLGFAYTETQSRVFNREIVYGAGYRISDRWSLGFEHRYDFEDDTLRTQQYEVRRIWDCWESAIRFRDRESGFDVDVEFSISAFPGTRLKL